MSAILSESLAVGVLLMLLFGAAAVYLYSRITYTEKRLSMLESILVDIKMMMESVEQEGPPVMPLSSTHSYHAPHTPADEEPEMKIETEIINSEDESIYAATLEQAPTETEAPIGGSVEPDASISTKVGPNYDAMTRAELVALVEQHGGRTTKRTSRGELIVMLRKYDASNNGAVTTGENASSKALSTVIEVSGSDISMDTGNAGAELEEATL